MYLTPPLSVGSPWNWVTPGGLKNLEGRGYQVDNEVL